MSYVPHETLVAPARLKSDLWRIVVGIVLAGAAYLLLTVVLLGVVDAVTGGAVSAEAAPGRYATTPLTTLTLLATFLCMGAGIWLAARLLHGRSLGSLIGPAAFALRDFVRVMRFLIPLSAVFYLVTISVTDINPNTGLALWLTLLPLSLTCVLIQVSAEEIVFRGYLQSQLAARFKSPLIWIGIPSVLFALGHYSPADAGSNAAIITLWALIFGALAADLTARTGTLGAAIALHFANNALAILVVSVDGSLSGLALYTFPFGLDDTQVIARMLPLDFVSMICAYAATRLALRT